MRKVSDFFKVGDIVTCVQASFHITIGMEYKVTDIDGEHVWVINDDNCEDFFLLKRFYNGRLFKPNDKIVCISPESCHKKIKNKIYNVVDSKVNDSGTAIIFLVLDLGNSETQRSWFKAEYFEKVSEKQRLIFEQFEEILK